MTYQSMYDAAYGVDQDGIAPPKESTRSSTVAGSKMRKSGLQAAYDETMGVDVDEADLRKKTKP